MFCESFHALVARWKHQQVIVFSTTGFISFAIGRRPAAKDGDDFFLRDQPLGFASKDVVVRPTIDDQGFNLATDYATRSVDFLDGHQRRVDDGSRAKRHGAGARVQHTNANGRLRRRSRRLLLREAGRAARSPGSRRPQDAPDHQGQRQQRRRQAERAQDERREGCMICDCAGFAEVVEGAGICCGVALGSGVFDGGVRRPVGAGRPAPVPMLTLFLGCIVLMLGSEGPRMKGRARMLCIDGSCGTKKL